MIFLRDLDSGDIPLVNELLSDQPVSEQIPPPEGYTVSEVIQALSHNQNCIRNLKLFAAQSSAANVGLAYYQFLRGSKTTSIALCVSNQNDKASVSNEILRELIEKIKFSQPDTRFIRADACSSQPDSIQLLLAAGFELYAVEADTRESNGLITDTYKLRLDVRPSKEISPSDSSFQLSKMLDREQEIERLKSQTQASFRMDREAMEAAGISSFLGAAPRNCLEVGCGTGGLSIALAKQYPESSFLATDISSDLIEIAAQYSDASNVVFKQEDAEGIFDSSSTVFDFIFSKFVLSHFSPEKTSRFLEKAYQNLSPGGVILAVVVDPTFYQFYPPAPLAELVWKHREFERRRSGFAWDLSKTLGIALAEKGFTGVNCIPKFFSTCDFPASFFASVWGNQMLWGTAPEWQEMGLRAQKQMQEWARQENAYAQGLVSYWIGWKK